MFALFSTYTRINMYVYAFKNLMSSLDMPHTLCIHVCVLVVSIALCDGPELFVAARLYQDDWRPFGPPRFIETQVWFCWNVMSPKDVVYISFTGPWSHFCESCFIFSGLLLAALWATSLWEACLFFCAATGSFRARKVFKNALTQLISNLESICCYD